MSLHTGAFISLRDDAESGKRRKASFLSKPFSRRFSYLGHRTKSTPGAGCLDVVGEWIVLQGEMGKEESGARSSTEKERHDSW